MDERDQAGVETAALTPLQRYSATAIILHWTIALALFGQLSLGFWMTRLPSSLRQFELYQLHKSIGITILLLSVVRLMWRLIHPAPLLPATMKVWDKRLARLTHAGLYLIMIGVPVLGWLTVSASPLNIPTLLWDMVPLPHLPVDQGKQASESFAELHSFAAWGGVVLVVLHVAGALKHHFVEKDEVLWRMLPRLRPANKDFL